MRRLAVEVQAGRGGRPVSTPTPLLNRSTVRQFTRVGDEFFTRCEVQLKNHIRDQVHRHPSVGKTIK